MVSAQDVQKLLDEIDGLRKSSMVRGGGNDTLAIIGRDFDATTVVLARDAQGKFAPDAWATLTEDAKTQLYNRLTASRAALNQVAVSDGPTDQKSIMYKSYASNGWILALTILSVTGTIVLLLSVRAYWSSATEKTSTAGISSGPPEANILTMIILMGALGGLIHLSSSLGKFVGNRQLVRSWIIYYLLMPFEGASLAAIIYLLLRVGVLAPTTSGSSTADLNLVGLYAFAGLAGLFSKQAIDMLADVFATIFKKVKAKDALDEGDSGGGKVRGPS